MYLEKNYTWIKFVAKLGLAAKGTVYCLIGLLAFMSAFHFGGQTTSDTSKEGVFQFILEQPAGKVILAVVAFGLLSYSIWRFIQTFLDTEDKGSQVKGIAKRITYFLSGMVYLSFAYLALRFLQKSGKSSGSNSQQDLVQTILQQPAGQILLGIVAAIIAGIGIYQIWYGNSEKYKKHVNLHELEQKASKSLLRAGKVGYIARGIVWLIVAFLFLKAAMQSNASKAGNTSSAFDFVQKSDYGKYLLAALAFGLIAYGVMNFIRAVFEKIRS